VLRGDRDIPCYIRESMAQARQEEAATGASRAVQTALQQEQGRTLV